MFGVYLIGAETDSPGKTYEFRRLVRSLEKSGVPETTVKMFSNDGSVPERRKTTFSPFIPKSSLEKATAHLDVASVLLEEDVNDYALVVEPGTQCLVSNLPVKIQDLVSFMREQGVRWDVLRLDSQGHTGPVKGIEMISRLPQGNAYLISKEGQRKLSESECWGGLCLLQNWNLDTVDAPLPFFESNAGRGLRDPVVRVANFDLSGWIVLSVATIVFIWLLKR